MFYLINVDVQCVLLNYFGCSICFVELFWMFNVFRLIILDVQCVLLNYFGCSVCFVELFWMFRVFC